MNIRYTLHNISFEWDSRKAAANAQKHEISFESACEALFDPCVFYLDDEVINDEVRETIIGMTANWRLLYVVYVLHGVWCESYRHGQ
ncbi:MAG: BrnT family toxin [Anaerolineae bacterium]